MQGAHRGQVVQRVALGRQVTNEMAPGRLLHVGVGSAKQGLVKQRQGNQPCMPEAASLRGPPEACMEMLKTFCQKLRYIKHTALEFQITGCPRNANAGFAAKTDILCEQLDAAVKAHLEQ